MQEFKLFSRCDRCKQKRPELRERRGLCDACRESVKSSAEKRRSRRKSEGLCVQCGAKKPAGAALCLRCTFARPCRSCGEPCTEENSRCYDHDTLAEVREFIRESRAQKPVEMPKSFWRWLFKLPASRRRERFHSSSLLQHDRTINEYVEWSEAEELLVK